MGLFTATKLQVATYLLGVCPFSIAFLVFLNSSVSFVVTDLIGQKKGVGDAVGSLGFADELLALAACPLWGLLSDRIGLRWVCVSGYLIISIALVLFVQPHNVYPQLLLARLLFSLGGAAASTMVTAILPAVAGSGQKVDCAAITRTSRVTQSLANSHVASPSIASEVTITPARYLSRSPKRQGRAMKVDEEESQIASSTSRVAGFVGMFTGCGALIALTVFLPLPARFQYAGVDEKQALKDSFYIVAAVAIILAIWCFIGLRNLQSAPSKGISSTVAEEDGISSVGDILNQMFKNFQTAILVGFNRSEIAIGYIGGFVARASSVAVSLFIPLLVNAMFLSSDLCKENSGHDLAGLPELKRKCPRAYVVASELTGVSQTVALISAPIFGYVAARSSRKELPLLVAAVAGIIGYPLFPAQFDPNDNETGKRIIAFVAVCLIGISQIGAIVCSLGTLSKGILVQSIQIQKCTSHANGNDTIADETAPLLSTAGPEEENATLLALKGSIAGVYSLYGGAAILILTKIGGLMFDKVSLAAPFYIMAAFNVILLLACVSLGLTKSGTQDATAASN